MQTKAIAPKYFPARPPILFGCVSWLMLDRLQAAGWVCGVVWSLVGLVTIGWIYACGTQQLVHPKDV